MAVCDAETMALGLDPASPSNATAIQDLVAELGNLNLEEKQPEDNSDLIPAEEHEDQKSEPQEAAVAVDGWGSDPETEKLERERDLAPSYEEVKVDGWGWDQDFSAPEGNQEFGKYQYLSSEVKEGAWGWDKGNGGVEENAKSEKGLENWREEKGQWNKSPFPLRPNEQDCAFYMKTGTCKFELNCKFNHPPSKLRNKGKFRKMPELGQVVELNDSRTSSEMLGQTQREKAYKENKWGTRLESNGQMDCKYYSMPGGCKYGSACKYNHREKTEVITELNFLGLPMRPGEKECTYYMSTGSCKYSINCRFHHPDPIAVGGQDSSSGYQNGGSSQPHVPPAQMPMTSWPLQQAPNEPAPFLDASSPYGRGYFLSPQGHHPSPEWNGYQATVNPLFPAEINMLHPPSAPVMDGMTRMGNVSAPKKVSDCDHPERPGQPECQFFMKTGTCKFQSACKFHHPKSRHPKVPDISISSIGLPLRPDQPVCAHYSRHGVCKFGHSCRYDHPMDSNPTALGTVSIQNVFPVGVVESLEAKPEGTTISVHESEW